jgi:ABC-type dipeptide/oligopeptide/nickel transport system ATPase component
MKSDTEPTFFRCLEENFTDELFETLETRRSVDVQHSYISSIFGTQGSGKSYSALSLCGFLDQKFSIDKIYFDYSQLVYDRRSLKPHSAILVDEQAEAYGIDSMRVSIILKALKEQLRKKSVHFFFCSPTLKPEHDSSMYIFETMFIDHKTNTCYAAYKTRDLLTLGYVEIPHPLQFISKDLLAAYEEKKDLHLDQLTGKIQIDEIEEAAKRITQHPLFISAEKLYKSVRGYIPTQMLIQLINKIYPEFKANVMAMEIASRVKLNKEMTGEWSIIGQKKGSGKDLQRNY